MEVKPMAEKRTELDLAALTEIFRKYGADEPEDWARSQIEEGIPQLALFSFCKSLWAGVLSEDDSTWIDEEIRWSKTRPTDPCAQAGTALTDMLAKGVSRETIIDLVRVVQFEAFSHACVILDGARIEDVPMREWMLVQYDEDSDEPIAALSGTHELLLGLDPTGREMRPRPT
jgi:hypothetical protein